MGSTIWAEYRVVGVAGKLAGLATSTHNTHAYIHSRHVIFLSHHPIPIILILQFPIILPYSFPCNTLAPPSPWSVSLP